MTIVADTDRSRNRVASIILRSVFIPLVILVAGKVVYETFKGFRKKPVQTPYAEPEIDVNLMTVKAGKVRVVLSGYGTVQSRRVVQLAPEVSGRVIETRSSLENGDIVKAGDLLFKIDSRDYQATLDLQVAEKARLEAEIDLLRKSMENNRALLKLRREGQALADKEHTRLQRLLKDKGIGSQQVVEAAKIRAITAREGVVQLENELSRDPLRLKSLKTQIQRVEAQIRQSRLALDRCRVTSPFAGRLAHVQLEAGQLVAPTHPVLTIVDDAQREVEVSLKSDDVVRWLSVTDGGSAGWFRPPKRIDAGVRWVEGDEIVTGTVDRISRVDEATRTVYVAISIPNNATGKAPLVPGMYCRVEIPGITLESAMVIPQHALTAEGKVLVAENGRLASRKVNILRRQNGEAVLALPKDSASGSPPWLKPGERLITSAVLSPIEGQRVRERKTHSAQ